MRNRFANVFYELGKTDPRLVVVVADISPAGSIAKFREDFPDRFINTGVAEQVMIGLCAGMAQRGMRPFAYTIATFTVFRPYEMIRDDLCYQDLPVTIVGIGGGVSYSTLGGTHHAMEDVALMTGLPNMQVIAPCDPAETELATRWLAEHNQHPAYLRLGKAGEPDLTANAPDPFTIGRIRRLRQGKNGRVSYLRPDHERCARCRRSRRCEDWRGGNGHFRAHVEAARCRWHRNNIAVARHGRRRGRARAARRTRVPREGDRLGRARVL